MGRWLRTLSTKAKTAVLAITLVTAQVLGAAAPFMPAKVFADPANNGTLKVHEIGTPSGTESNDPKVCAFNFEGFGFDAGQDGQLQIDVQGNDAPHGTNAGPFTFGPTDANGYAISQDFNTPNGTPIVNGHYKVTLYGKDTKTGLYDVDLKAKSKVFKVDCGVTDVAPVLNTQVSSGALTLGQSVTDTATFTPTQANGDVTGTVDFFVCGPAQANPNCTAGGTQVGGDIIVTNNQAVSAAFTPTQDGHYCFRANYTPDGLASYLAATHTNQTTECFTVTHTPKGTITVIKNVDTDGDGVVDQTDVTNWNWNINGQGNFATGSTNTQTVNTGTYTVAEVQKPNFHVTASSCTNENIPRTPTTSLRASVSDTENVVCTFTNTRDTGRVVVNKQIVPAFDNGRFNLAIDGTNKATNVGDNGTTGNVTVLTGAHSASEAAFSANTDMTDYDSSYVCRDGIFVVALGTGTSTPNFNVATNHTIVCTFTNVRHAHVTVIKDANPDGSQAFNFNLTPLFSPTSQSFSLFDDGSGNGNSHTSSVSTGIYTVSEDALAGWDLNSISCNAIVVKNLQTRTVSFLVLPGQNLTCTFKNVHQTGTITVNKQLFPVSDNGKFNLVVDNTVGATAIGNGGTTGAVKVLTGLHSVSETAAPGTNLSDYDSSYVCNDGNVVVATGNGTTTTAFVVANGDAVVCTFTNQRHVLPQVLGDSTSISTTGSPAVLGAALTNTGLPVLFYTLAATSLLGAAIFVITRRNPNLG
jgi:hypothetical protein